MGAKLCTSTTNWEETNQFAVYRNDLRDEGRPHFSPRSMTFWVQKPELKNGDNLEKLEEIRRLQSRDSIEKSNINDCMLESSSEGSNSSFKQIITSKNLVQKQQKQEIKLSNKELKIIQTSQFVRPRGFSTTAWDSQSSIILSDSQESSEISGKVKGCEHNSHDVPFSATHSRSSIEDKCSERRRMQGTILLLADLPSTELKSGYSCSYEKKSITSSPEYVSYVIESDSSSIGGQGSSPRNKEFHEAECKEVADWLKNWGLDNYQGKNDGMSKMDASTLFSLSLYELIRMGVLEYHAKGILAVVHPMVKDWYNASDDQLPHHLSQMADSDQYSSDVENSSAAQTKQLAQSQIIYEKQKQQITELEATVTKQKVENESLAKECEDLRSRNKTLNAQFLQNSDSYMAKTQRIDTLQKDLDQCVAEVDRLETVLEDIRAEKNKFWKDLQLKNQKCCEQREMIINLQRKYSNEVKKLQKILNSENPDICVQSADSDSSYSVAFDDLPSEKGEFFTEGDDLQEQLVELKSQGTERDEKWQNSQDDIFKLLQSVTNSCEMGTDVSFSDKEQAGQGESAHYNPIIPFADTLVQTRGTSFDEQNWFPEDPDDMIGDVSHLESKSPAIPSESSTQYDIAFKENADTSFTFEPLANVKSSSSEAKNEQALFTTPMRQLSPRTLSSLMLFNKEPKEVHQTTSTPSTETTALKQSDENFSEANQCVSHSIKGSTPNLPEIMDLGHTDAQRIINRSIRDLNLASQCKDHLSMTEPDEFFQSSPGESDGTKLCGSSDGVSSRLKLVDFVAECFKNVTNTGSLLSWNAFVLTLSKHFCCSNELLRSVFDECNSYNEEKISLDDFKEKLQWDVSDAFVLFRNAIFNHRLFASTTLVENDSPGFMDEKNLGIQLSLPTKAANGVIFDTHQESIPAGELASINERTEDLSNKLNVTEPRGSSLDSVDVESL